MIQNKTWLKQNADIVDSGIQDDDAKVYVSKIDGSYLARVGMEQSIRFLVKRGITMPRDYRGSSECSANIGYSESGRKWYGWSHRAIYGFSVGSSVKKGDCAYRAKNIQDEIDAAILFWSGEHRENVKAEIDDEDRNNIIVKWIYPENTPNEKLRLTIGGAGWHFDPDNFGNGEWTAKSTEDARQMACDFAEGVS